MVYLIKHTLDYIMFINLCDNKLVYIRNTYTFKLCMIHLMIELRFLISE